jgi:cell division protein FtsL
MVRVLNFFCVALCGLTVLGLYHVSEKTRVARMELASVNRRIVSERSAIAVLQTEWQYAAAPSRVQALAQSRLNMSDSASVQLSSFDQLPRRGENAPLNNSPVRNASAQIPSAQIPGAPASSASSLLQISDRPGF